MNTEHLTEALLEMHFHPALLKLFEGHFGRKFLRILKPSQNREAFLGFDQGWVRTNIPLAVFRKELEDAILSNAPKLEPLYVGYFLQFKRIHECKTRRNPKPPQFGVPYLRAELDLRPNKTTGRSQHETLLRLQAVAQCDVNYACPMILDEDAIYDDPNIDDLRIVPLCDAPTGYASNERHFICFQHRSDAQPQWCSEPVPGRSWSTREWLNSDRGPRQFSPKELLLFLDSLAQASVEEFPFRRRIRLPSSLTIVELGEKNISIDFGDNNTKIPSRHR